LPVDIVHVNDWQTGLIPAYLKIEYASAPGYEHIVSLMTIHNMAYQGQFWHWDMLLTGIDWKYFNWHQMEFYGKLNLLKTGIVFADSINTVSPRYSVEIQQTPLGCGLEKVLHHRRGVLSGIINGVDYDTWNPAIDPHLPVNYGPHDWEVGKAACKRALQSELGLPVEPSSPLLGIVSRLADQKGFDLISQIIENWARTSDAQWCIVGTGEPKYHQLLTRLNEQYPHRVAVRLEFNDRVAHLVEAGADMFIMPSQYEPCGLNQLYSLKYGTVPIVHATGGLADTISTANGENLATRRANGFSFDFYDVGGLETTLKSACDAYRHDRHMWTQLVTTGMQQDWSWKASAAKYVELYELTMSRSSQAVLV
jgi:starch synthase